jgi:plastocyanin
MSIKKEEKEMKSKKWILSAVLTVAAAVAVSTRPGLTVKAADQMGPAAVKIDNFSFGPQTLTVAPGTTVTWTNNDDVPHTVVSDDKVFKSKALDTDDKFSYTFDKPGTYNYFCSVHPKMTAKVVVK